MFTACKSIAFEELKPTVRNARPRAVCQTCFSLLVWLLGFDIVFKMYLLHSWTSVARFVAMGLRNFTAFNERRPPWGRLAAMRNMISIGAPLLHHTVSQRKCVFVVLDSSL